MNPLLILKLVPLKVWIGLALAAAVAFGLWRVHSEGFAKGKAEAEAEWQVKYDRREAELMAAQARQERLWRDEKAKAEGEAQAAIATLQKRLDAAKAAVNAARRDLEIARSRYVSAKADAACVVPVGFLLYHNRAAIAALGQRDPAEPAEAAPGTLDAPSGTTLSTVADTTAANLLALGECRNQVLGWQEHWKLTERWHASLSQTLGGSP